MIDDGAPLKSLNKIWLNSSNCVQNSEDHVKFKADLIKSMKIWEEMAHKPDMMIDNLMIAVTSAEPAYFYMVGSTIDKLLTTLMMSMPEEIQDIFLCNFLILTLKMNVLLNQAERIFRCNLEKMCKLMFDN